MARGSGAGLVYAATLAASGEGSPLRQLHVLSRLTGHRLPDSMERALHTREVVGGRSGMQSARTIRAVDRDIAALKPKGEDRSGSGQRGAAPPPPQGRSGRRIVDRRRNPMRRLLLLLPLAALIVLALVAGPARAAPGMPPMPEGTPQPMAKTATVAVDANVRNMPHRNGSGILEVLKAGSTVAVYKRLDDSSWIGVMTPDDHHGWMHRSVLTIDAGLLASLPVATDDLMEMDMPGMQPTPTAAPHPTAVPPTPTPAAVPGTMAIVTLGPGDAAAGSDPAVTLPITLQVCVDLNASKTCDADAEGVAQIPVVVADTRRAAVIGRALTNTAGVATLTVSAPAGSPLTVSVPSLASVQTLTMPQAGSDATLPIKPVVLPPPNQLWPLP
jgi:hypothetical protein